MISWVKRHLLLTVIISFVLLLVLAVPARELNGILGSAVNIAVAVIYMAILSVVWFILIRWIVRKLKKIDKEVHG